MILKILPRKSPSYKSLIEYIFKEGKTLDGNPHVITHNIRSDKIEDFYKEFLTNEASRIHMRSNQTYMYHEILSFSNKENNQNISIEMLDDIAQKYISLRGNDGQFVGSIHNQAKEHFHIHFCVSGVRLHTGMAMRMSKDELQSIKLELQNYHKEKYPELEHSFPQHGKGREYLTDREWYYKQKESRTLIKEDLAKKITECYTKAHTQKDFLELLQKENLPFYERNGKPTGIYFEDTKYRFSRLGLSDEMFKVLPVDRREEDKALAEIRAIRAESEDRFKEFEERDIEVAELDEDISEENNDKEFHNEDLDHPDEDMHIDDDLNR